MPVALTPREREVLTLLSAGLRKRHVAIVYGIPEESVKTICAHIRRRMRARSMTQAVAVAIRHGVIR